MVRRPTIGPGEFAAVDIGHKAVVAGDGQTQLVCGGSLLGGDLELLPKIQSRSLVRHRTGQVR